MPLTYSCVWKVNNAFDCSAHPAATCRATCKFKITTVKLKNVFQLSCLNPNPGSWKGLAMLPASCLGTPFTRTFWSRDLQISLSNSAFDFVCSQFAQCQTVPLETLGDNSQSWHFKASFGITCGARFTSLPPDSSDTMLSFQLISDKSWGMLHPAEF